jgi:uncharacterized surface anchored protein
MEAAYIVEELTAPAGYLNSGYRQEIVLKECRVHTVTVSNYQRPSLKIVKKDKVTAAPLPDATFRVSWNNGADYQDVTTDEKGEAVIPGLNDGWYTITETAAPEGYLFDSAPHQLLLAPGEDSVIELFNEKKPSLTITKVDSVTNTPLRYAKFRIESKTGESVSLVGEYVSDADGIVRLDNITPGRYLITEITAPDGYNIDNAAHEVTIESGQAYSLEFTNTAKLPIYIQKVDDKGNPLMGAKFKVTTMNGAMVGTVTTGRTGYAIIPYAEPGWYVVEEIAAPDGYILSSSPVNVEVKSGRPAQVEFVNTAKPQLTGGKTVTVEWENRWLLPELAGKHELPNDCFSVLPSTGELVFIVMGEKGYYPSGKSTPDRDMNRQIASAYNALTGVTRGQEEAMLAGSLHGLDKPAACPWKYDQHGNPRPPQPKRKEQPER